MSCLPAELLHHIVKCLVPANPPLAFPASHVVTRTLSSLCLVSKTVHFSATRCLFAHCVYIDSADRLQHLHQTLQDHHYGQAFGSSILPPSRLAKDSTKRRWDAHQPSSPILCITSLFLAPFPHYTIDSPEIALLILGVCTILGPHLTRLVIDIPLRSLYPEDDTNHVRPFLHAAFSELVALEEFVSTRDELFLDVTERVRDQPDVAVWSRWSKLRRLALYNVDLSSDRFIRDLEQCQNLTHLVLTRADGLAETIPSLHPVSGPPWTLQRSRHLQRLSLVNTTRSYEYSPPFPPPAVRAVGGGITVFLARSGMGHLAGRGYRLSKLLSLSTDREGHDIEVCQEWVREAAIEGTLWEWEGTHLTVKT